jgi:hypothetical protein
MKSWCVTEEYLIQLLHFADEAAKLDSPVVDDFPLPPCKSDSGDFQNELLSDQMILRMSKKGGKGMFANCDISAGTLMLIAKPMATVMDWEEYDDDDDEDDDDEVEYMEGEEDGQSDISIGDDSSSEHVTNNSLNGNGMKRNGMLVLRLIQKIQKDPKLWFDQLSQLFPRNAEESDKLPCWICEDETVSNNIENALKNLSETDLFHKDDTVESIRRRLPLKVKYNCFTIETSPELFVYPNQMQGGHSSLCGTSLYLTPSFFNHDFQPNVVRWAIGDVLFFVTNQDVKCGQELCISYIESESLCECSERRTNILDMDFNDSNISNKNTPEKCSYIAMESDKNGKHQNYIDQDGIEPVMNPDVQAAIMAMPPLNRIDEINDLLKSAQQPFESGAISNPVDEVDFSWFRSDVLQLRILLAFTFDGLGMSKNAMEQWEKCVHFVNKHLPPNDESSVAIFVQAALSSFSLGNMKNATKYASQALKIHSMIFGNGVSWFRERYKKEFDLQLRPTLDVTSACNILWPYS